MVSNEIYYKKKERKKENNIYMSYLIGSKIERRKYN